MSRPTADPALTAQFQFDQDHAAYDETLDDLEQATVNLVTIHGERRGLSAMTAFLASEYGDVRALAPLLAVAMYRHVQQRPAGR